MTRHRGKAVVNKLVGVTSETDALLREIAYRNGLATGTPRRRKRNHVPVWFYGPNSRTKDGYLTVLIDSSTALTLSQWADLHGLPIDALVRYGIDLAIERLTSQSSDELLNVMKRSSRHHVPEGGLAWGWGYRENEMKATLPKEMLPQFRECRESESWGDRERKVSEYLNSIAEVKGSDTK